MRCFRTQALRSCTACGVSGVAVTTTFGQVSPLVRRAASRGVETAAREY